MQVEVDVKYMQFNFSGHGLFGFGDFVPFCFSSNLANFPQKIESAQKNYAIRG